MHTYRIDENGSSISMENTNIITFNVFLKFSMKKNLLQSFNVTKTKSFWQTNIETNFDVFFLRVASRIS